MKNRLQLCCLALAAIVLVGCSGAVFKVFNNTGRDLTVISYDTVGEPSRYLIKPGDSSEVASPTRLVIQFDGGAWEYPHYPRLDPKYRDSGHFGPRNYKFQVEKDGAIYILPPRTKTVLPDLPPQPEGFPIRPK